MTQEQADFTFLAAEDESCGYGSVGDYYDRLLAYMAGGEL
jgi:hypothetical protein